MHRLLFSGNRTVVPRNGLQHGMRSCLQHPAITTRYTAIGAILALGQTLNLISAGRCTPPDQAAKFLLSQAAFANQKHHI